jgi:Zn finger protein HypA/HybF involved in hydrogenase expression
MNTSFAGTATRDTHYLPVSDHQSKTFLNLRNIMTILEAVEIERAKLHPVKCSKCKVNLMIRPTEKECPVCGSELPTPKEPGGIR